MEATNNGVLTTFEIDGATAPGWRVLGATYRERLNEAYALDLRLRSDRPDAEAREMLGKSCELVLTRRGVTERVAGVVTEVQDGRIRDPDGMWARLTVEPALAALRHRVDTRIFQNVTVPQILEEVLGADLGAFDRTLALDLHETYPEREYCVQYRESDFDFALRLMEEEGIGFHFEHPGGPEVLTLFDRKTHHRDAAGETGRLMSYDPELSSGQEGRERVFEAEPVSRITGTKVTTLTFDWTHPSTPLMGETPAAANGPELEAYVLDAPVTLHGYAGAYGAHNATQQLRLHRELQARDAELVQGRSSSLALRCGGRWELNAHPRVDLNREYVIVEITHRLLDAESAIDDDASAGWDYANRWVALPAEVPWRPDRTRARPQVLGIQTATVVGPAGEEIHTDDHGRVKVHFHWDRHGAGNDQDSCWIRVMQAMGGAGWGFTFVPRIGMEVVVTFIDGDPDRPLITGVVYNTENRPPIDLPADKTRTTIKTNSSLGGGGDNELRFEDKAGEEEIYLHGQKDWNTLIEHDLTRVVRNDEAQQVVRNRTREVGVDEQVTVGQHRRHSVGVDETIEVGQDRTRAVGQDESVTIGRHATRTIVGNLVDTIRQNMTQTVMQGFQQSIMANFMQNVVGNAETSVVLNEIRKIGMNRHVTVGNDDTLEIEGDWTVKVGGKVGIECNGAKIILEDGNVTIEGEDVVVTANGQIVERAGGDIALNGAKIKLNC